MKALVAMAANRVIGLNSSLPWHIKEDLRFFKQKTEGQRILVGEKTFRELPLLPDREVFVATRAQKRILKNENGLKALVIRDLLNHPEELARYDIWLGGGASMYKQFLPICSELFVTHINAKPEGDTYMPPFEHLFDPIETIFENEQIKIVRYLRKA